MYFPFLRGKQYELLALREFAKEIAFAKVISPIIEPVKSTTKAIESALSVLYENKINFTLIANPSVGEIKSAGTILNLIANSGLKKHENFQIGFHVNNENDFKKNLEMLNHYELGNKRLTLIHNDVLSESFVNDYLKASNIIYNVFNEEKIKAKRYRRLFERNTCVILEDAFSLQEKNKDYIKKPDEFYSDEYLAYNDEGYVAFSDFLTIGESYSDAGFLPYAVAIHVTYATANAIRKKHFVSDSNEDSTDTPGKFKEALDKLISAMPQLTASGIKTKALEEFEGYHEAGHYPGLGTIKKLSVLNHLELMTKLLSK